MVDDEVEMGAALIDFGGGSTTVGVYVGGRLVLSISIRSRQSHHHGRRARLSVSLADAGAPQTLYGSCISSPSDDRDSIAVHRVRRRYGSCEPSSEVGVGAHHSTRVEEILNWVRDRLKTGPCRPRWAPARTDWAAAAN